MALSHIVVVIGNLVSWLWARYTIWVHNDVVLQIFFSTLKEISDELLRLMSTKYHGIPATKMRWLRLGLNPTIVRATELEQWFFANNSVIIASATMKHDQNLVRLMP